MIALQAVMLANDAGVGAYSLEELSDLVVLDLSTFKYVSGGLNHSGISPWGSLYFGEVNESTKISFDIINNNGAYFKNVRVTFTVNWFDGIISDAGYVMYRDSILTDVPPGKGSRAGPMVFTWTPQFSGSYSFNITIQVPNDRYPASDARYGWGLEYQTGSKEKYRNGYWIGSYSNDCSSIKDWSTEVSGGLEGNNWHVSDHPLGAGEPNLHTSGKVFWAGNDSSLIGPLSGVYSLISPLLDLSVFDDSAFNPELSRGDPQIYFLYRYRGNLTPEGRFGRAGLYHYVSLDEGETWEGLLDPQGKHVIISGNTSSPIWDNPKHKTPQGSEKWGLDLSRFQGKRIMLKIQYRPSGYVETGFLLDDFVLIGKEKVDISTFRIVDHTKDSLLVSPGNSMDYRIEVISLYSGGHITLRSEVISASSDIDISKDVKIDPAIMEMHYGTDDPYIINVRFYPRAKLKAGPGWIRIRMMADNTVRDAVLLFEMIPVHNIDISLSGRKEGPFSKEDPPHIDLYLNNSGNIPERLFIDFGSDRGLIWNITGPVQYHLEPGDHKVMGFTLGFDGEGMAGRLHGHLIVYKQATEITGDQISLTINGGAPPDDWMVWEMDYEIEQTYNISIYASNRYAMIREPPSRGTENITFHIGIINNGNGNDTVILSSEMYFMNENITVEHDGTIDVPPMSMDTIVPVKISINYPVSPGLYRFRILALSESTEGHRNNHIDLSVRIGREEVPNGVYIDNSTLTIEPARAIVGSESVISFETRSFGLPEDTPFSVNIRMNGSKISTTTFFTTRGAPLLCQIKWVPQYSGVMFLSLDIEGEIAGINTDTGMVQNVNITFMVHHIDLSLQWHLLPLDLDAGPNRTLDPGTYYIELLLRNEGDITAELISIFTNLTTDSGDVKAYRSNLSRIDPGEGVVIRLGPFALDPLRTYHFEVQVPVIGRWRDVNPEDNVLTYSIQIGEPPPGEPVWRDPIFLIASSGIFLLLFIFIIVMIYRRK